KALWVLFILIGALPFLFPAQWFFSFRPQDELKVIINNVAFAVALVILIVFALIAALPLPNDVKNQTIYTVVTKPVQRFEIVLGLVFGHVALMTLVLGGITLASLLLISISQVNPTAQEQTFKARVPVRGTLVFATGRGEFEGVNVGREFEYRK